MKNARLLSTRYPLTHYLAEKKEVTGPLGSVMAYSGGFCHSVQEFINLQQLTANEVGPAADLGGDTLLARHLLVHALSEELGSL